MTVIQWTFIFGITIVIIIIIIFIIRITIIIIITCEAEDVSIGSSEDGELNQNGIKSVTRQFQIVRLIDYYCLVLFLSASEPSLNFVNSQVAY